FLLGFNQQLRFFNIVTTWLFHINMLTRLKGHYGHRRVPMIRRGNKNRIYVLIVKDSSKITFGFRSISNSFFTPTPIRRQNFVVNITDKADFGILIIVYAFDMGFCPIIDSNNGYIESLIRAHYAMGANLGKYQI